MCKVKDPDTGLKGKKMKETKNNLYFFTESKIYRS